MPVGVGLDATPRELVEIDALTQVWSIDWSPDGTRLAYIASVEEPDGSYATTLRVVAADGSAPRTIAELGDATDVDWAGGDGRALVSGVRDDQRTLLVDVASGRIEELDRPLGGARWSRDGTPVVGLETGPQALVEAPIDGASIGPATELLSVDDLGEDTSFAGSVGRGLAVTPCA